MEKTENVCVLYRVPYNLQWKKPQIQQDVQKIAFGGTVSQVSDKHRTTNRPPVRHSRAFAGPSPCADDPDPERSARQGQIPQSSA